MAQKDVDNDGNWKIFLDKRLLRGCTTYTRQYFLVYPYKNPSHIRVQLYNECTNLEFMI